MKVAKQITVPKGRSFIQFDSWPQDTNVMIYCARFSTTVDSTVALHIDVGAPAIRTLQLKAITTTEIKLVVPIPRGEEPVLVVRAKKAGDLGIEIEGETTPTIDPLIEVAQQKLAESCPKCRGTGVIETGNNDLPCDCPAGDTAEFSVCVQDDYGYKTMTGEETREFHAGIDPLTATAQKKLAEKSP